MNCRNSLFLLPFFAALAACGPKPCAPAGDGPEARFVVELAAGRTTAQIDAATESVFGCTAEPEPLFEGVDAADDAAGLGNIYVVSAGPLDPSSNPWDTAYALLEQDGIVAAEPDLSGVVPELVATSSAGKGCKNDGVPKPDDKAWSVRAVKAPEAWAIPPRENGGSYGEGIDICHIDTGWADHEDLDKTRIDLSRAWNILERNNNAKDPLTYVGHRGHGTATASVIMSSGGVDANGTTPPGEVTGIAPRATLVPIRAMNNVVQIGDSDVAKAVHRATRANCDVISMSLGGRAFFGLERAINDAVLKDAVVVAAAGNCVGFMVAPALYDNAIAVAATNAEAKPWAGTSKGKEVVISAPGEDVYRAFRDKDDEQPPHTIVGESNGTSYATAIVAGAAALWVAHLGDDMPVTPTRQAIFQRALTLSAKPPPGWDASEMGAGILDIEALLNTDPSATNPSTTQQVESPGERQVTLLARQLDLPRSEVLSGLQRLIGDEDFDKAMVKLGPELLYLAATESEAVRASLAAPGSIPEGISGPAARQSIATSASKALAARINN